LKVTKEKDETMTMIKSLPIAVLVAAFSGPSWADSHGSDDSHMSMDMMAHGLVMPEMNAAKGRALFAAKGCVVCHSVNGVGGTDAPMLDAEFMDMPMNPFEFAARMWRGAPAMVEMQRDELGDVIELNGEELASIIAFVHDADEQAKFSESDIPENIAALMSHMDDDEAHGEDEKGDGQTTDN
jgi:mono/diheme cytochrome c family protein